MYLLAQNVHGPRFTTPYLNAVFTCSLSSNEPKGRRQEIKGANKEVEQGQEDRDSDESGEPGSATIDDPMMHGRKWEVIWGCMWQRQPLTHHPHPSSDVLSLLLLFVGDQVGGGLDLAHDGWWGPALCVGNVLATTSVLSLVWNVLGKLGWLIVIKLFQD